MEINLNVRENQEQIVQEIIKYTKGTGAIKKDEVFYCLTCYWRELSEEEEMWRSLSFEDVNDFLFDIVTESIYLEHHDNFYNVFRFILPTLLTNYDKTELLDEILFHFDSKMKNKVVDIVGIQKVSELPQKYLKEVVYYVPYVKKWIKTKEDLKEVDVYELFCSVFNTYHYQENVCNHLLKLGILDFIDKDNLKIQEAVNDISNSLSNFYKCLKMPEFEKLVNWGDARIISKILCYDKNSNITEKISILSISPYGDEFKEEVVKQIHGKGDGELVKISNEIHFNFRNSLNEDQLYIFTFLPELQLCMDNEQLKDIYKKSNTKKVKSKNLKNFIEILRSRGLLENV